MATFTETLAKIHAHASKELAAKKAASRAEQVKRKPAAKQHKPGDALKGILLLIIAPVIFVILFVLLGGLVF